jgi:hypothetical protein
VAESLQKIGSVDRGLAGGVHRDCPKRSVIAVAGKRRPEEICVGQGGQRAIERKDAPAFGHLTHERVVEDDEVMVARKICNRGELESLERARRPGDADIRMRALVGSARRQQRIDRATMLPGHATNERLRQLAPPKYDGRPRGPAET